MKPAIKILWHEQSNTLVAMDLKSPGLPIITFLQDMNCIVPVCFYPLSFLKEYYGWKDLGDL